jgi:hypothetical protein
MTLSRNDKLIAYLTANRAGSTYLLATTSSQNASPIIIKTGQPVMALGGFMGSDQVLSLPELQQLVNNNTVRFFLLDGSRMGGKSQQIYSWIEQSCQVVEPQLWSETAAAAGASQGRNSQVGSGQSGSSQGVQPGTGGNGSGNRTGPDGTGQGSIPGFGGNGSGFQPGFGGNNIGGGRNVQPAFGGGGRGFGGAQGQLYDCRGA